MHIKFSFHKSIYIYRSRLYFFTPIVHRRLSIDFHSAAYSVRIKEKITLINTTSRQRVCSIWFLVNIVKPTMVHCIRQFWFFDFASKASFLFSFVLHQSSSFFLPFLLLSSFFIHTHNHTYIHTHSSNCEHLLSRIIKMNIYIWFIPSYKGSSFWEEAWC